MENFESTVWYVCADQNSTKAYRRFWRPTFKDDVLALAVRYEGTCWAFAFVFSVSLAAWLSAF